MRTSRSFQNEDETIGSEVMDSQKMPIFLLLTSDGITLLYSVSYKQLENLDFCKAFKFHLRNACVENFFPKNNKTLTFEIVNPIPIV